MKKPKRKLMDRSSQARVSDKIRVLREEGKTASEAAGEAFGMERSGRLRSGGRYIHKRKGRHARRSS